MSQQPGFFGVFNEAWVRCCRVHNIDITLDERERLDKAMEESYYHPDRVKAREEREG